MINGTALRGLKKNYYEMFSAVFQDRKIAKHKEIDNLRLF